MSVVVIGQREGLTIPFQSEDYLIRRDHVVQSGQDSSGNSCQTDWSSSIDNVLEPQKRETIGLLQYGCVHYRRRCRIRAPCCGEVFDCRHCHNEAKNMNEWDPKMRHDLPRHAVESVICSICSTEQEVQQICKNCGVCMGEYFCGKCRFYDDETQKRQYHCDACGICRVGGRDKFFHCHRCGCCYSTVLQQGHRCVEKSMHHNCAICFEYLFDSLKDITVMPCGHTMHLECLKEMRKHSQFCCPICSKSVCDMTKIWQRLDQEIAVTPMPDAFHKQMVWILCSDCNLTSEVPFHIIAHKCANCNSYNTRRTKSGPSTTRT